MAVTLSKSQDEINQMPLVELAWAMLKAKSEPIYFKDLMREIQTLRSIPEDELLELMARLYTEINIDGRFVCIGQNVWGLKRWYPVDKATERTSSSKRFVRRSSGDAFSDDDEDLDIEEDDYDDEVEDADTLDPVSDEDDTEVDDSDDSDDDDVDESDDDVDDSEDEFEDDTEEIEEDGELVEEPFPDEEDEADEDEDL